VNTVTTASSATDACCDSALPIMMSMRQDCERFRLLVENSLDLIVEVTLEGQILYVSPNVQAVLGYGPDEIVGTNAYDHVHPDDLAGVLARFNLPSGHRATCRYQHRDGSWRWLDTTGRDYVTSAGHERGVLIARDVTAVMHEAERLRSLESQLFQAQKMESIGILAGGIAHDFNNILTGILGFAEIGRLSLGNASALDECLAEIRKAGLRARDLVAQILTFSRQGETKLVPLDFAHVVGDTIKFLRASAPTTIKIERRLASGLVRADPTQVHQVVLNLATNAVHAMRDRPGLLTVTVDRTEVDAALAARLLNGTPGTFMRLTICDTGHGMDATTIGRIFEPFFTTKPTGEGTGLGLAVVQGILRTHHGAIAVESTVGQGTKFCVYLPMCEVAALDAVNLPPVSPGHGEHVLLVDDEVSVGQFAGVRLEQLGYRVSVFNDPLRALITALATPGAYDIIVSDYAMPGLNGLDLVGRVREIRPDIPAVIITGNRAALSPLQLPSLQGVALLDKPFTGDDLVRALQGVLPARTHAGQR
jgi:PAS domain S-box-containing protein